MTTFATYPVADSAEELTPEWLTAALASRGHDLEVSEVAIARIGTGQMGTTYRLDLEYAGAPGPATLIAKMAAGDPASRSLIAAGYAAEVGFYTHLAPELDVRTPTCWYGAITDDTTAFTLLLDDASPAQPGVQADGCPVDRAGAALANLIGLHAPRWCDPVLYDSDFLMQTTPEGAALLHELLLTSTDDFVARYADDIEADHAAVLRDVARVIEEWFNADTEHFSVLHGDYRLDNLMFGASPSDVVAVDWQTASIGPPARDVAYFLGTSLAVGDRRAHEERLVADYHRGLVDRGIVGYDIDRCWDDYRLGQLQGPMITILGCMLAAGTRSAQSDAMFLAMATRSAAAISDLHSLDLL